VASLSRDFDYRKKPCPKCGVVGQLTLDTISTTFRCNACGQSNIEPYRDKLIGNTETKERPTSVPIKDSGADFVADTYKYADQRGREREVVVSRYQIAKTPVDNDTFDPNTPEAQFYLRLHAKRFKNRRRYLHDREKRQKEKVRERSPRRT
jgi:hypothetical protein